MNVQSTDIPKKHDDKLSESSAINQVVPEIISVEVSEAHYLHEHITK